MIKRFLLILAATIFVACGTPNTFNDKIAVAQTANTSLVQTIGIAAQNGKISKADATNLLKQVDTAEEGIKLAKQLGPEGGSDKLALAQTVLNAVNQYLITKGASPK